MNFSDFFFFIISKDMILENVQEFDIIGTKFIRRKDFLKETGVHSFVFWIFLERHKGWNQIIFIITIEVHLHKLSFVRATEISFTQNWSSTFFIHLLVFLDALLCMFQCLSENIFYHFFFSFACWAEFVQQKIIDVLKFMNIDLLFFVLFQITFSSNAYVIKDKVHHFPYVSSHSQLSFWIRWFWPREFFKFLCKWVLHGQNLSCCGNFSQQFCF